MDEQAFALLQTLLKTMQKEQEEMKADIKALLSFRWQVVGGLIVFNIFFGVVCNWAIAYIMKS
jgi:hypothetical protein